MPPPPTILPSSNATIDIYGDAKGTDDTYYFTSSYERLVADDPNRSTSPNSMAASTR